MSAGIKLGGLEENTMSRTAVARRIRPFTVLAAGLLCLAAAAPARADILYLSNNSDSTIMKFTSGGVASVFASSGLDQPRGLAFDSAGNLYAANLGAGTIEKFTPGGVGSVFAGSGLNRTFGLAFDSAGSLYAANLIGGTIEKFTPGGIGSVFASTGVGLTFIAFTNDAGVPLLLPPSVPEPSTLASLCLGLPALLVRVRRRRTAY